MGRDDFHLGEVAGESVQVNRPAIIQGNAAAAVGIRAQDREADMEQCRLAACLDNFPNVVVALVIGIKALIGRMKLKPLTLGFFTSSSA